MPERRFVLHGSEEGKGYPTWIVVLVLLLLAAQLNLTAIVPAAPGQGPPPWLIVAGVVLSIPLQIIWLSGWAIVPLLVDAALLWIVFGMKATVAVLR